MNRVEILREAEECVSGGREEDYGRPEDNFGVIARLWNVYLSAKADHMISAEDVAVMMGLLKIARIAGGNFTEDSYVDACGYMACGGEIASKREAKREVVNAC